MPDVPPLELPRSARLVMWGNALRAGQATVAAAVAAISGDDEPHVVTGSGGLTEWLTALVPGPAGALRLVLPAPGDPAGLPGPPAVNELAVAAGECALTPELALIPRVERFGSMVEPGHLVTWQPSPVTPRPAPGPPGLTEADRSLREALGTAVQVLAELDVAAWREEHAAEVAAVRDGDLPRGALPPGTSGRAVPLLARAARVRAIVALAGRDDGGARTGWQAERRRQLLREVDGLARRGLEAAVSAGSDPR